MIRFCHLSLLCCVCITLANSVGNAQVTALADAEQLLLRGNYEESNSAFAKLREQFPIQATLGLARGFWEQGQQDQAIEQLDRQIKLSPNSAHLHAERAHLALHTGELDFCRQQVELSLASEPQNIQARWVQAELWRVEGKIAEACKSYRELSERYDREGKSIQSPQRLFWFAQALAQHARFNHDKKRFRQLTNQLYPRMLSLEPNFWSAHCQSGLLLLEKFNAADAEAAFNDAQQINPQAANVQVGLARLALTDFQLDRARRHLHRALQANPKHQGAFRCQADLEFASLRPQAALQTLQTARKSNLRNAKTLGRIAAAHQLLATPQEKFHRQALSLLIEDAKSASANLGDFYAAQGLAFEQARRYPQAAACFREAIERMPQLLGPRGQLGMIEMRLGHEDEARRWLEASFERDPYNVRVKNQLEVLDLLEDYATLETEHFVIRYDAAHDESLARTMARYAEQCYGELATTFDFQLPERALLEVFHNGRGVKAREWFGARMVGLPNIHTIAACGGNVVAMVSPTAERGKLNWADILRHEIVHLINIQQTDYAVPHWLTEGCAVWQEARPRRRRWQKLLIQRVPRGDVFDLESINFGFLRPRSADDWQLVYCQAEIYVELIASEFGVEGIRNLLAAYRDNLTTQQAIAHGLGTTQERIERSTLEKISSITTQLAKRRDLREPTKLAQASERWAANPDDLSAGAELALVRLRQGDYPGAGRLAETLLAKQPSLPSARFVKAQLLVRIGDELAAAKLLEGIAEPAPLKLLAGIHLRRGKLNEARRLYQLGADRRPDDLQWSKALAVVAIRQQDTSELIKLLTRIADAEPDNLIARKKLLQLAKQNEQRPNQKSSAIEHWANEVLHIDPNDRAALRALEKMPLGQ